MSKDELFSQKNPISEINKYASMENNAGDNSDYLMRFRSATFSWGTKENPSLEIEDLKLTSGIKSILLFKIKVKT